MPSNGITFFFLTCFLYVHLNLLLIYFPNLEFYRFLIYFLFQVSDCCCPFGTPQNLATGSLPFLFYMIVEGVWFILLCISLFSSFSMSSHPIIHISICLKTIENNYSIKDWSRGTLSKILVFNFWIFIMDSLIFESVPILCLFISKELGWACGEICMLVISW